MTQLATISSLHECVCMCAVIRERAPLRKEFLLDFLKKSFSFLLFHNYGLWVEMETPIVH